MPLSYNNGDPGFDIRAKINGLFGQIKGALADPYELEFDTYHSIRTLVVTDDIELTGPGTDAVSFTIETLTLTGDGIHTLTWPEEWKIQGDTYDPTKVQRLVTMWDGTYVTGVITTLAFAEIPAVLASATLEGASSQFIGLVFDKAVTITTGGWSVSASGGAVSVSSVANSGTMTPRLVLSRTIADSETVTVSYDPGTGATTTVINGAELNTISGQSVTNNVYAISLEVPFTGTSVDTGKGTITNPDSANLTIAQNGNLRAVRTTDNAVAGSTTNYWRSVNTYTRGVVSCVMNKFTGFTNSIAYYQYRVDANNHISILKLNAQSNAYLRITAGGSDVYTFQSAISITNRFRIEYNSSNEIRFKYWTGTSWEDVDATNPVHINNIGAAGNVQFGANSSASDATNDLFYIDELYVTTQPYTTVTPA